MTNKKSHAFNVSIRITLTAILAILSLMVVGTLGWVGKSTWEDHSKATEASAFNVSANRFIAGLYQVLLERLDTNNALQAPGPATPAVIEKIEASRKIIKDNFDIGLAGIERYQFPNKDALLKNLSAALQKANDYRRQADAAIKLPREQRDENLRKTFVPTLTDSINAGLKVWFSALYATSEHDPQLERLATIKEIGWRLRDYSGQERAIIATALASGSPIPAEGWTAIIGHRARVAVLWDELENLTVGADPVILDAVRGAKQKYFQDFVSLANEMKKISDASGKYPMTAAQWIETTNPQIGSLLEVLYAARKASETLADETLARALRHLTIIAALTALAIAIAAGALWIVAARVTRPLSTMSGLLMQLAQGNKAVEIPFVDRGDEIGDNARAAQTFKENLLRMEQIEAEQKANEVRTAAEREAAMQKMADDFQAAVGDIVQAAVAGDFSQRVDLNGKTGLVLKVGTSINLLCENVAKALDDLVQMLNALAQGDLTRRIKADYQGNFGLLKDNANKTAERIGATIAEIKASAAEVTNASAEISGSTTDLSQRTEEQAASLEETSASMEEISATVKKNAENAQAANQSASATREVAERGGQVVAQAVEAMAKIEESSRKIGDIIGVIDEIARQTNLLALNAAVEAARAGEAGRGFAVVASEVRSLAQRASQAAKDIKDLITNSNGQVKEGVDLVNRAGASLTEIVDSIKKVAGIVADIANASGEQASGIEQVNKALTQMDTVTQQNSALVEENAATAKTLEHQAHAMDERVAFFRIAVGSDLGYGAPPAATKRPAATPPSRGPAAAKSQPAAAKQKPAAAPKRAAAGGGPVGGMHAALASAVNQEPDWKEF